MKIKFVSTDTHKQDQYSIHWYNVNGETFGLCETFRGEFKLVDSENYPIDSCNDHDGIFDLLCGKLNKRKNHKGKGNKNAYKGNAETSIRFNCTEDIKAKAVNAANAQKITLTQYLTQLIESN